VAAARLLDQCGAVDDPVGDQPVREPVGEFLSQLMIKVLTSFDGSPGSGQA
jgi:hypothetical protein